MNRRSDRDRSREDFDRDDRHGRFGGDTEYGQSRQTFGGGDFGSQDHQSSGGQRRGFGGPDRGEGEYGPRGGGDYSHGDYRGGVGSGDRSWRGTEPRGHDHGYDRYRSEGSDGSDRGGDERRRDGARGYEGSPRPGSSGRPYGGSERGNAEGGRDFWDKASDQVASWFGGSDSESRRRDEHRGRGPKGYSRSDDRIREDVNDRLTDDGWIDASNVEVAVEKGEVTLSGTVSDRGSKRRAEDIAESVSGVSHVQNNLRVHRSDYRGDDDSERNASTAGLVAKPSGGGQR